MENYKYSPGNNAFYPTSLEAEYTEAGTWPDDLIDVSDDVYREFASDAAPEGKQRIAGSDGLPAWEDIPPPTKEQLIEQAETRKQALIAEASQKTQLWQTQLILGIITEKDKASLKEWMLYVQDVQAVDPSPGAGVVWPTLPASPAR